jgi:hypothetical protein
MALPIARACSSIPCSRTGKNALVMSQTSTTMMPVDLLRNDRALKFTV